MVLDADDTSNTNICIPVFGTAGWWQRSLSNKADLHIRRGDAEVAQSPLRAGVIAWRMVSFRSPTFSVLHRTIWSLLKYINNPYAEVSCRAEYLSVYLFGKFWSVPVVFVYCGAAVYTPVICWTVRVPTGVFIAGVCACVFVVRVCLTLLVVAPNNRPYHLPIKSR